MDLGAVQQSNVPNSPPPYTRALANGAERFTGVTDGVRRPSVDIAPPAGAMGTPPAHRQRLCAAARLPAYRNARFEHYRAHPYRRAVTRRSVETDEDAMDLAENISITDIINSPRYICVTTFGFDPQEQPSLTSTLQDPPQLAPPPMGCAERITFLAARIADIDAATNHINAYALDDLETRVLDFVLFVRQQLVEQREAAVLASITAAPL
ncbi:hypothetical protein HDZ31DRAFT_64575 [Schizophyllum fasciatum]